MASISFLIAILSYAIALCGIVPLFPWLDLLPRCAILLGLTAGIWQSRTQPWPLKNWMFNAATVPVFLFYAAQYSSAQPVRPVVSVLAIMLAVRLAGPKNSRHYLQSAALSLFCLASSSLFDLSMSFLLYLTVMLFLVAVLLVLLTFYSQNSAMELQPTDLRKVLVAGALMPLVSLPLLVFFFPLLPRTQLPLWNFLAVPVSSVTGFSEVVEPGTSASNSLSRVLAFRVEMPRQPQQQLYWRGTVLNRIEGRKWLRVAPPNEDSRAVGQRISQTIYPEPGPSRILLALDAPAFLTLQSSRRSSDGVYEYQGAAGKRYTYSAESIPIGRLTTNGDIKRPFYLVLPDNLPGSIRQLADSIRRQGTSDAERLERLETFFRNGGYRYSMTGLPTGEHALETFLFEGKQGHCEFFASSFALILRAAGVPARLVGGYLGGEYNQMGGYYLVSDDMAHVWVEVYIAGQGWLRVDPSSYALNAGAVWAAPKKNLLLRMRLTIDSLNHTWNRAVISYDFERQIAFAHRIKGFKAGMSMKTIVPYIASAIGLAAVAVILLNRKRLFPSREERLLRTLYRRVRRKCGVVIEPGRVGLFEIADRTDNQAVRDFAAMYAGAVYRDRRLTDQEFERLKRILSSI